MASNIKHTFTRIQNTGTTRIYTPSDPLPPVPPTATRIDLNVTYNDDGTPIFAGATLNGPTIKSVWCHAGFNAAGTSFAMGQPLPRPQADAASPLNQMLRTIWEYGHHPDFQGEITRPNAA